MQEPEVVQLVTKDTDKGKDKKEERTSIMSLGFIKPVAKPKEAEKGISSLFEQLLGKAPSKALDIDDEYVVSLPILYFSSPPAPQHPPNTL